MCATANTSLPRDVDLITGHSLSDSIPIVDLAGGGVPIPGLFFSSADAAAAAVSRVRLVKSLSSGLIQLDRDINPALYTHYKSGAATAAHFRFLDSIAEIFLQRYSPAARILEIGGNAGHFMRALHRRGFRNLYVVDPSLENQENDDFTVIRGLFPEAVTDKMPSFDVVVGQHVLEHSSDPVSILRAARNVVAPDGDVWIEVPDIEESAHADGGNWLSIVYALHSAYFDSDTLKLACAYAGLEVETIRCVNHYGKSLLAICRPSITAAIPPHTIDVSDTSVVEAIQKYFCKLSQLGERVPAGTVCWGAAERCIAVLGGCMNGGFKPGGVIDSNADLHGLYVSGMSTPVMSPAAISGPLPAVLILSPQNAAAIAAAQSQLFSESTKIYVPTLP